MSVTVEKLQAVSDLVEQRRHAGGTAGEIIAELKADHGAEVSLGANNTNSIRIAGVTSSCTWSTGEGLLDGWRRLAARHLEQAKRV